MINKFKKIIRSTLKAEINRIKHFKGKHADQACYIFGNGVSLKYFELKQFNDRPCFVMNMLPFHKEYIMLGTPKYCILPEPYWFYKVNFYPYFRVPMPLKDISINYIQCEYRNIIRKNKDTYFVNLSNYPVLRGQNIYFTFTDLPEFFITNRSIDGYMHGSLKTSIALALYMGFKKITFVGCDYTHNQPKAHHWYERGKGIDINMKDYNKDYFNKISRYAFIETLTAEGLGSTLPSVTYKEFTGKDLFYRENYELTSIDILKVLATFSGYNIF